MLQNQPVFPLQTRQSILDRFRVSYSVLTALFSILLIVLFAWHWNQPRHGFSGFPFAWSVPILSIASVLINGISFYFQNRYVHQLLKHPKRLSEFSVSGFGLRFYLYNLVVAIVLSIICFIPLLFLLFFFWIYPIAFWLFPYHLLIGFILGGDIKRQLRSLL